MTRAKGRLGVVGVAAEATASFSEVSNLAVKLAYLTSGAAFRHGIQDIVGRAP